MKLLNMLIALAGFILTAPAHALVSLHVIAPHRFASLDFTLAQDYSLILIGLIALAGAVVYRFRKAR